MSGKRVLSIGQCGADHASISYALRRDFDAEVIPVMLVSNYADAQAEAVAAGAVPGFGKGRLGQPEMLESVRPFLVRGSADQD